MINFKCAENKLAGIEYGTIPGIGGAAFVDKAVLVGRAAGSPGGSPRGIITPRVENFRVTNSRFYNFDFGGAAAFGTCSHCFGNEPDSGARTIRTANLTFINVTKRINWQYPKKAIFFDEDGSLTDKGPNTWVTPYQRYNNWSECTVNETMFTGHVCDSTVQVRRIVFTGAQPSAQLNGKVLKILPFDDNLYTNRSVYENDASNWGGIAFLKRERPTDAWAVPIVTGHKYKIKWGWGVDFTKVTLSKSPFWQPTDRPITFVYNHLVHREKIKVIAGGK